MLLCIGYRFFTTTSHRTWARRMSSKTYYDAVNCLNSLQSNQAMIEASRASGGRLAQFAMHETAEYLSRIGYTPESLNKLNVIHVTGTKGKGSTCAFADSLLRRIKPDWKIGLYTSPHLVAVRERIRINGKPISEEDFAKYFFEVWDRLEANETRKYESTPLKPMYFRMVTLVAYHAFMDLKVDATILEVGVGGLYDCTNIVPKPVVTGVSALGIDHVTVLGKTLKEIAWQKGGIYKEGVPALSVAQPEDGIESLQKQAHDRKASKFEIVPMMTGLEGVKLGLSGAHQYQNANLAIHLVEEFLREKSPDDTFTTVTVPVAEAVETARWPGRCQTVHDPAYPGTTWFLDGAHTLDSLECCAQWFFSSKAGLRDHSSVKPVRALIFNCTHGRNGLSFLSTLLSCARSRLEENGADSWTLPQFFEHVVFCTNVTYADGGFKGDLTSRVIAEEQTDPLKIQRELSDAWISLLPEYPKANIHIYPSIEHAVKLVHSLRRQETDVVDNRSIDVLVAGSLHLVGGIIEVAGLSSVAL